MGTGTFIGYQLVLRATDDRVLCPDAARRRALARTTASVGLERGLLAFGAADTHLHVLAICDRPAAGKFAQALALALRPALRLPVGFDCTRITPIEDQHHLRSAFAYVQRNARRHGVADPDATEASSLHDLLGLRRSAPWLPDRVRRALPRVTRAVLVELMAVPEPADFQTPGAGLADAAAALFALPDLAGKGAEAVRARVAALSIVEALWTPEASAKALGITPRAARRLALREVDALDVAALRRQLAWRETVRRVSPESATY